MTACGCSCVIIEKYPGGGEMKKTIQALMFFLAAVLLMSSCATTAGNYGVTKKNNEVYRIFRSGPRPTEYRYYYNGVEALPTAILGIRKDYTLRAKYWHEIDMTEGQVKNLRSYFAQSMFWYDDRRHGPYRFEGYSLLDPQGQEFGILYSRYDWTVIKFPEDKVVVVYPPQPANGNNLLLHRGDGKENGNR